MNVYRDLSGGILVIIAAAVIAIAQNAVRSDGIPLVPKPAAEVSGKPYTPAHSPTSASETGSEKGPGAGEAEGAASLTADELASGVVTRERLEELLAGGAVYVIDARLPGEFAAGHIEAAVNIPYEKLPEYYDKLTTSVPFDGVVVCYCQSDTCEDSENLAREMKFMGYKNVLRYKGGWDEWSSAGGAQGGATQLE